MKKLFFIVLAFVVSASANAQVWVGGNVEYSSTKYENTSDTKTTILGISPEVGYNLNEKFAVALALGYSYEKNEDSYTKTNFFTFNPYVRYNAVSWEKVTLFVDGSVAYRDGKIKYESPSTLYDTDYTMYEIGLKPGISYAICDKVGLVAHMGFLGYSHTKQEDMKREIFDFNLTNNLSFGAYFNF